MMGQLRLQPGVVGAKDQAWLRASEASTLAGVEDWADIEPWLTALRRSRKVFHSEADFQHALALAVATADPEVRVRLETRPAAGMRLDLLVSRPGTDRHLAVELKYLTTTWGGTADGERFDLLNHGAQDIRAYDVVKDVQRVEQFVADHPNWSGLVLVLANDPAYWSQPVHGRATNADAFRIYEGQVLSGTRAWGPLTGTGTMKDRELAIELRGSYQCHWLEYSSLPGSRGTFRMLALTVGARGTAGRTLSAGQARQAQTAARPGVERETQAPPARHAPREQAHPARQPGTISSPARNDQRYSVSELNAELLRFERELRGAGLKDSSITTYVDRTARFLRWLAGDYRPTGPNSSLP
jgi:hypothetical protein